MHTCILEGPSGIDAQAPCDVATPAASAVIGLISGLLASLWQEAAVCRSTAPSSGAVLFATEGSSVLELCTARCTPRAHVRCAGHRSTTRSMRCPFMLGRLYDIELLMEHEALPTDCAFAWLRSGLLGIMA